MANTHQKTNNKRRPAKARPPLKSVKKISPKPDAAKKTTSPNKKRTSSTKKRKATVQRRSPSIPKTSQKQLISVPVWRGINVSLTLNRKSPVKSAARKSKKKSKLKSKKINLITSVMIIAVGSISAVFFGLEVIASSPPTTPRNQQNTQEVVAQPEPVKQYLSRSEPLQLRIPDIGVNTTLSTVALNPDKTLEVPAELQVAGWYRLGPTPGEIGPAVIAGHYDNAKGTTVFARLHELVSGQLVEVVRKDGTTAQFIINKTAKFPQSNFPTEQIYGNTDNSSLRLITCGGSYNSLTRRYSENTVVFASLIPPQSPKPLRAVSTY